MRLSALLRKQDRLPFVDCTRALATLMMVQGHALDVLLLSEYRASAAFHGWTFVRGLTSCTFLFLSGFSFAIATRRRWADHTTSWTANVRRVRWFGLLLAIGYLMHYPGGPLANLSSVGDEAWRAFLAVDVLQCIAVTLFALQMLVLFTRTVMRFATATALACVAVVATTPLMWQGAFADLLPFGVAAYLSPGAGSLFPLWPWSAYMLLGSTLGALYGREATTTPVAFSNRILLPVGVALVGASIVSARLPIEPFGRTDFWSTSPSLFLLRAGLVLVVVSAMSVASRLITRGHGVIRALAEASLIIYVVHVCFVYGSAWNTGLRQLQPPTTLVPALGHVAGLWVGMTLLAVTWSYLRQQRELLVERLRLAVTGRRAVAYGSRREPESRRKPASSATPRRTAWPVTGRGEFGTGP